MKISLKGTRTEQCLLKGFAGEAQARNRYTYFSQIAQKEGYEQIGAIFLQTAEQERMHAKRMFCHLEGGELEITATYPAGRLGTTAENLREAAWGEHEEWNTLYPSFAQVAEEEGFHAIGEMLRAICVSERNHEAHYLKLLENIELGHVFHREDETMWICRKCGYIHVGKDAPQVCVACGHPRAYFEIKAENF